MTMSARRPKVDRQAHKPPPLEPPQINLPSLLLASPSSSSSFSSSSPCSSLPLRPSPSSSLRTHNNPSASLLPSTTILVLVLLQLAWGVHHAQATTHLPRAAVFYDPNLVDTSDDGSGEGYNVLQTLSNWGYHYTTIETNVLADWRAALDDAQMLIFPEPGELGRAGSGDPLDYLGLGVINQVRMFVAVGGLFVQLGDNLTVVPYVFNLDWTPGGSSQDPSVPTPARASSVFANCTYSLAGIDLVYHYNVSANSSACLQYKAGTNNGCTLMRTTYGQGVVTWIGYDWYQARPVGTQDSGWVQVLQRALSEAPSPPPSPSASPSATETPSNTPSQSPSQSSSPTASVTPSQSPSAPPSITPSPTSSRSQTPSTTPSPSTTLSPSLTPSMTPSGSPSFSPTPSSTRSPSPSRTPSKSATPSGSPAPATGKYPDTNTSLHFFSQGPNVRIVEESSNRSAVLKFTEITLRDANDAPFSSIPLPTSDYEVSAEVEASTGVETFGFATTLNEVPMVFNFTHPLVNDTLMSFADVAFVVERGAVKWLWAFDGAWPFDSRASGFTLTASLELEAAGVTGVERLNDHPRPGRTTYSVNHHSKDNGNNNGGKSLEVKFVVFDRAVSDGELVDVVHAVELVTTGGAQVAHFHFTFPAFRYTFVYDPELVLVVREVDGESSASPGGLIAGIVALAFIGGLVGLAVVRSALAAPPADEAYRGLGELDHNHVLVPTDDIEQTPPPLTKGRRPSYDAGASVEREAAPGRASSKRSVAGGGGSGGNNRYRYDYEEEDDNFYRGEGDFEMEVLSRPTATAGAKKQARTTRIRAPSQSSGNSAAKGSSHTVREEDDDGTYDSEFNGRQTRSGGRAAGVHPNRPRAPTAYQWEGTDDDTTYLS